MQEFIAAKKRADIRGERGRLGIALARGGEFRAVGGEKLRGLGALDLRRRTPEREPAREFDALRLVGPRGLQADRELPGLGVELDPDKVARYTPDATPLFAR